jgi:beta-lactamase regulating signal transducer with metallopeptidase domain
LLIAAIAWLLLRTLGKQDSRTRFAVWFSALLAVAALPFVPGLAPNSLSQVGHPEITLPGFWAVAIFAAWMLVALVASCRIAVGLWHLRRLRRSGVAIDSSRLPDSLQQEVDELRPTRTVAICQSSLVQVPTAIGFFKPVILLPEWVLREVSADELRVILLHELAHLRRWDDWTNLVQKLVRTVFFFHPAVWWIEKRISLEREMACDDAVLAQTENPRAYAECLVSLAEKSVLRRGLAMAQAILGHARDTSLRLARILDAGRPKRTRVPALAVMTVVASVCLVLLPHSPTLIGFETNAPSHSVTASSEIAPSSIQASVVPVKANITDTGMAAARPKAVPTRTASRQNRPQQVLEVKRQQPKPSAPALVQISAPENAPPPQILLLMQTTQYENGVAVTNVYLWRLTFATQNLNTVQEEWIVRSL